MASLPAPEVPEALFERHGRAVRLYLARLTGSDDTARDLTQEVFLRVVRSGPDYAGPAPEAAWLFRVARTVFLDHQRHAGRHPTEPLPFDAAARPDQALRLDLQQALAALQPVDRDIFLLCKVGGARTSAASRPPHWRSPEAARPDGRIDLMISSLRMVVAKGRGLGDGGSKRITVGDGETVEVQLPPILGTMPGMDIQRFLAGQSTSVRVTARRVR